MVIKKKKKKSFSNGLWIIITFLDTKKKPCCYIETVNIFVNIIFYIVYNYLCFLI